MTPAIKVVPCVVALSAASPVVAHPADENLAMLQLREVERITRENRAQAPLEESPHAQELAFVQGLAEEMSSTGSKIDEAAKEALKLINQTLGKSLELIESARNRDETMLNTLATRASECVTNFTAAIAEDAVLKSNADTLETEHSSCRTTFSNDDANMTAMCDDLTNYITGLKPPSCGGPADKSEASMEAYWDQQQVFANNKAIWKAKQESCSEATAKATSTDTTCDTKQGDYESTMCSWRLAVVSTCSEYQTCHSVAKSNFDTAVIATDTQQNTRKTEFALIKLIQCYVEVLVNDDESKRDDLSDIEHCKALHPDTSELDIDVPTLAEIQSCDLTGTDLIPCTPEFESKYTGMLDIQACQACPILPPHLQLIADQQSGGDQSTGTGDGATEEVTEEAAVTDTSSAEEEETAAQEGDTGDVEE